MEYGSTVGSRYLSDDGANVLIWSLDKIIYKDGNYISYNYDPGGRNILLSTIKYGGNLNNGQDHYNWVSFNYQERVDSNTLYIAGSTLRQKYLLTEISTMANWSCHSCPIPTTNNSILFEYAFAKSSSYLNEVKLSNNLSEKLNSTIFKYDVNGFQFSSYSSIQTETFSTSMVFNDINNSLNFNNYNEILITDLDNDGEDEIINFTTQKGGNGEFYYVNYQITKKNKVTNKYENKLFRVLPSNFRKYGKETIAPKGFDFDGNGINDLLFLKTGKSGNNYILSELFVDQLSENCNTILNTATVADNNTFWPNTQIGDKENYLVTGDFNGDGKSDIITFFTSSASPNLCENRIIFGGNSFIYTPTTPYYGWFNSYDWHKANFITTLDHNGDGKEDIMLIDDTHCDIFSVSSSLINYEKLLSSSVSFPTLNDLIRIGDFNGDGKTDFLARSDKNNNNSTWYVHYSNGVKYSTNPFSFNHIPNVLTQPHMNGSSFSTDPSSYDKVFISDFNGDGKSDIMHAHNTILSDENIDIYYSTGVGFILDHQVVGISIPFLDSYSQIINTGFGNEPALMVINGNPFSTFKIVKFTPDDSHNKLTKIKNGLGFQTHLVFKALSTENNFYLKNYLTLYPNNTLSLPILIVQNFKEFCNQNLYQEQTFVYNSLVMNKIGKGLLGFTEITTSNLVTGFKSTQQNEFHLTLFAPALKKISTFKINGNSLINEKNYINSFSPLNVGMMCYWLKTTDINENNVFENKFTNTNLRYDDYGNIDRKIVNVNNVENFTTNYIIEPKVPNIFPFKILSTNTVSTRLTNSSFSATTDYLYSSQNKVIQEKKFSGLPKQVTKDYIYHSTFGNLLNTTVSAAGLPSQISSTIYDSKGRFPIESYNTNNQKSEQTFDPNFGNVLTQKGIDGLTTSFEYDFWGKVKKTNLPEGYSILNSYGWDINLNEGTVYYHLVTHPGKPDVKIWYDQIGRERKRQIEGHNNEWITTKTTYDAKGNLATTTAPYKASEAILTTT